MNAIFITARVGSSRLPLKHLLKIQGKTCIEHVFDRAKKSKKAEKIILCTTILPEDDILRDLAEKNDILVFRGSVNDKLDRWNKAAKTFGVDFFVTFDADDLFCEPEMIDLAFEQHKDVGVDFIDWEKCGIICGSFTYGVAASALDKVCSIKNTDDTEMCWEYFTTTNLFKVGKLRNIPLSFKRPEIRATLDYAEDFHFFASIFDHFYKIGKKNFNLRDVVELLNDQPELILINQFRHVDWKSNQVSKTKVVLKDNK